jgi:hypothetical protein
VLTALAARAGRLVLQARKELTPGSGMIRKKGRSGFGHWSVVIGHWSLVVCLGPLPVIIERL